jgi:hypothetical protein
MTPTALADRRPAKKGCFFAVDQRTWAKLPAIGMNEAVAYLVLAQGTNGNHKATSWSVNALKTYAGISWERGKAAIENLIARGFIRCAETHTATRPRYEIATFCEWHRAEAARQPAPDYFERELLERVQKGEQPTKPQRKRVESLLERGILVRDTRGLYRLPKPPTDGPGENLIWLPNTIVTGTNSGEESPVRRLRSAGDVWALRLFVDMYAAHNLRDDGGITPQVIRQTFDRRLVGQQGAYAVWGFTRNTSNANFTGPFAAHQFRAWTGKDHPVWESVYLLQRLGLLNFVPHIFENSTKQAEIIHPYGIGGAGAEPIETELGSPADATARAMCLPSKVQAALDDGCDYFCPVLHTKPDVQMIGVARLQYRPHTRRTEVWFGELHKSAQGHIERYRDLAAKAETAVEVRLANYA